MIERRIKRADLIYWQDVINSILAESNAPHRINVRQHGYNSLTVIEKTLPDMTPLADPFYAGTRAEVYSVLRAMITMHSMLTES